MALDAVRELRLYESLDALVGTLPASVAVRDAFYRVMTARLAYGNQSEPLGAKDRRVLIRHLLPEMWRDEYDAVIQAIGRETEADRAVARWCRDVRHRR